MATKKLILVYDFDKTLCTKYIQEYTILHDLGVDDKDFWPTVERESLKREEVVERTFLSLLLEHGASWLTKAYLNAAGKKVELYPGLQDWFANIRNLAAANGTEAEHYVISCGLGDVISGCSIARHFKHVYANFYAFDEQGRPQLPKTFVTHRAKPAVLGQILNAAGDCTLIYIGDGQTDAECMEYCLAVKQHVVVVDSMKKIDRAVAGVTIVLPDYSKDGELFRLIARFLKK